MKNHDEDWKEYWRRNGEYYQLRRKDKLYKISKIITMVLVIIIAALIINKKNILPNIIKTDTVAYNDVIFLQLQESFTKSCLNLIEDYSNLNKSEKEEKKDNIIKIYSVFCNTKPTNEFTELYQSITNDFKIIIDVLNKPGFNQYDYYDFIEAYNNHVKSFTKLFENTLIENKKRYTKTDNKIIYYYRANPY